MAYFSFTKAILEGRRIDVFNHGRMRRDFTYIGDIIEGIVRVIDHIPSPDPAWNPEHPDPATSAAPYRVYNIGNHNPVELGRFIEILEECLGKKADKNFMPIQSGEVLETFADVTDLADAVGFRPNTCIETGIARFVDWYRGYYRSS
jgi:UDP-glucuronate 4-epimerase